MKTGKSTGHGLVPTPTADRPLTRAQETFRSLLERVESLRESIDAEREQLDATLSFYAAEILPRLVRRATLQKELVRALAPCLNPTFFRHRRDHREFEEFTRELLDEITKTEKGLPDPDLREIYSAVLGIGYAEHQRKTFATVKKALAQMFAEAGVEVDISELESAASETDFMAKAEELIARARKMQESDAAHCSDHGHHATDDEELRAAEEFRKRSIANIYKQLARVLHPDLELDRERQKEKVELMQELTVAFRENDLHTLLRLEMKWIENEGGNIERLTEEKLGVYNEVLAGQVEGLERQLRDQLFHPRYRPIVIYNQSLAKAINGPDKALEVDESIASIARSITLVKAAITADEVRAAIAPLRGE